MKGHREPVHKAPPQGRILLWFKKKKEKSQKRNGFSLYHQPSVLFFVCFLKCQFFRATILISFTNCEFLFIDLRGVAHRLSRERPLATTSLWHIDQKWL